MAKKPFELPASFITQLNEFTNGYVLITINELDELEVILNLNSTIKRMAMQQFIEMIASGEAGINILCQNSAEEDEEHEEDDD